MKRRVKDLRHTVPMAFHGLIKVLSLPRYLFFSLLLAFGFAVLIYFFIQIGFYGPLLVSQLPIIDKILVVTSLVGEMIKSLFTSFEGMLLLIVSLLQGVALAVMFYTMRRNKRFDMQSVGSGGAVMVATALGLGCVPCGTSLLMPIISLFFSSSAYAAANTASTVVLVIAFVLSLYSLYKIGTVAFGHATIEQYKEKEQDGNR